VPLASRFRPGLGSVHVLPIAASESVSWNQPPAITVTPAPASSKADITPTLEHRIGALVAAASIAIAEALDEHRHGALTPRTKTRGGDLICELVRLRQFLIAGLPNFDRVAREHGVAMLRAADVSPATANVLVDEVMNILHKVVRDNLN
jgi:hypothetical protein